MKYKKGYKYVLYEDIKVILFGDCWKKEAHNINTEFIKLEGNLLTIKKGYAWDGATWFPDLKSIMISSLIHDALYQLIRNDYLGKEKNTKELYRLHADNELYHFCIKCGMNKWLAKTVKFGVNKFAKGALKKRKIYEILCYK